MLEGLLRARGGDKLRSDHQLVGVVEAVRESAPDRTAITEGCCPQRLPTRGSGRLSL